MKVAIGFLLAGLILLVLIFLKADARFSEGTVDLRIRNTYLSIYWLHFVVVAFLFSITVFAVGGIIGTRMRNKYFLLTLLIVSILNGWAYLWFFGYLSN